MYLTDPSDKLFAYKCENNNNCPFKKAMNGKIRDLNFNNQHHCKNTDENMGDSESSGEVRSEELLALRVKFPTKIPIIIKRYGKEALLPELDKCKFLVPQEITMSQFQTIIRNRLKLQSTHALYLLVNNRCMISLSRTLAEVYSEHVAPNGFLYITYASQEVFGTN